MILDLIFPKYCLECKKEGKYICNECLKKVQKGGWRGTNYSVFRHEGVMRKAIIALKYKHATSIAIELIEVCTNDLKKYPNLFGNIKVILVPIPMYWRKENERGFNQTVLIGEKIAKQMGWGFVKDLLIKTKDTKQQVELKGKDRFDNLDNSFLINLNHIRRGIKKDIKILLFDDVYTTGSTIKEAAKVLQRSGFINPQALSLAR